MNTHLPSATTVAGDTPSVSKARLLDRIDRLAAVMADETLPCASDCELLLASIRLDVVSLNAEAATPERIHFIPLGDATLDVCIPDFSGLADLAASSRALNRAGAALSSILVDALGKRGSDLHDDPVLTRDALSGVACLANLSERLLDEMERRRERPEAEVAP